MPIKPPAGNSTGCFHQAQAIVAQSPNKMQQHQHVVTLVRDCHVEIGIGMRTLRGVRGAVKRKACAKLPVTQRQSEVPKVPKWFTGLDWACGEKNEETIHMRRGR